jgi:predicted 2-oxoglutarate/Fe(II)-dependent dioxygenase YbiX
MDISNYIEYYPHVIDKDLCKKIINSELDYQKSTYSTHLGKSSETEERVKMSEFWIRKDNDFYDPVKECFANIIEKYKNRFSDFSVQHTTDFRINCYSEGDFMSRHVDNIHHSHGQEWGYPQVSALLFLNDDYNGGEFQVSNSYFKTSEGSAIIFPSNFMFPHKVNIVTSGTRWSIITWLM